VTKIILHVGMGKTGTTSIQTAFLNSREALMQKGVDYLGLSFDMLDQNFRGNAGLQRLARTTPEDMRRQGEIMAAELTKRAATRGTEKFVFSNEAAFGHCKALAPFIAELRRDFDVSVILYVRNPKNWLPSAYNQWGINHKTYKGPIQPFNELGRKLVMTYRALQDWHALHSDILTVRLFKKSMNIVEDFCSTTGIELEVTNLRTYERIEPAESVLHAMFNNQFATPVLPSHFEKSVKRKNLSSTPKLEQILKDSFSYDDIDTIVKERERLFAFVKDTFGIDLFEEPQEPTKDLDPTDIRNRLVDYMLTLVMQQAERISQLEDAVAAMDRKA